MGVPSDLIRISETLWELPVSHKPGMLVSARIYATEKLIGEMDDGVFDQVSNVACLPGIVNHAFCMPDGHWGYGFPIGGVAATDLETGVISPGGIGFDINCGMRLVLTNLSYDDVRPRLREIVDTLFTQVPSGVGSRGFLRLSREEFRAVLSRGSGWCLENGYAWPEDLERTEEGGFFKGADPKHVSERAIERGFDQIGTLGSGNHYCEIQVVRPENVFDKHVAEMLGFNIPNQIVIMFHCGSRGFGHQVATDYLKVFLDASQRKYGITVPDRELACAPFTSPEGQAYFSAMKCAVNMAFANRQMILYRLREVFSDVFSRDAASLGMHMIYDVAHNTAKVEHHLVNGQMTALVVHRKGSTRALGPGMEELPQCYAATGQPVIIGGSMETGSHLLVGLNTADETFYSTAHGSGRTMSRNKAKKMVEGRQLQKDMESRGVYVRTASWSGLAEEAGFAYKDIDEVVEATELAGLSRRVLKLLPIGNIKG